MAQVFLILGLAVTAAVLIGMRMYLKHREKMTLDKNKGDVK